MSLFLGNAADFGFGHSGDALWHAFGLLCVPTCIIGVVLAFCAGLRYLLKNSTATESVTLWRLEMINGLQASIIALQLGVVKYHTNSGVLYIYSIIIQVIFAHVNGGVAANPIDIITKFRSREITRMTAIGCGIIQLFVPVIVRLLVWLCKNDLFFVMIDTCKVEMVYEHIDVIVFEIMISILLTLISCNTTGTVKKWVMPIATSSLQAIELYVYGINGLAPITVVTRLTGCKGISPKELFILYFVSPICGSAFGNILMTSPKPAQKVTSLDDKSILLSGKTLRDQLVEMTDTMFNDRYMLIDVRKPHEYEGGHIKHAINIYQKDQTVKYLYERDCFNIRKFRIPIFYSETKTRALLMLQAVRKADRGRNMSRYAFLDYPEQYVLDGGYKEFYTSFNAERDLCEPNLYVPRQQG